LLAKENGKPIRQTTGEIEAAIRIFRGYAAEATRLFGRQIPLDAVPGLENHLAVTIREPLGVVAALVPFNYPVELYAHKAAALAAGNAVVVQPPARCSLTLMRVGEIARACGVPEADGTTWTTVASPRGNTANVTTHTFTPRSAR
jgi:acyl-CoA reductase-like NAD-dependent aldehyde dehydrogenase